MRLAIRLGVSQRPDGTTWRHLMGASLLAGIGFTVALFVTNLAFTDPALVAPAKVAILAASALAGTITLLTARPHPDIGSEDGPETQRPRSVRAGVSVRSWWR